MKTVVVFVYGTLKRGRGNHALLRDAEFLGEDAAPGQVFGPFPVAKPSDNADDWIHGEVYRVTPEELADLDRLEGHPRHYMRTTVTLRSGRVAEIYYYPHQLFRNQRPIADGRWPEQLPDDAAEEESEDEHYK